MIDAAVEGLSEAAISRRLHVSRTWIRRILRKLEADRVLVLLEGGGRGRRKTYTRGPILNVPSPTEGYATASRPPPEIEVPSDTIDSENIPIRVHNRRFKVPLFEDEMAYRDVDGIQRRWTLGAWSGDYTQSRLRGVDVYTFREVSGTWRLFRGRSRTVRAAGKKNRVADRVRFATIVLLPREETVRPSDLDRAEEIDYAAALRLVQDIARNRRLVLHGLPVKMGETEYGVPHEEDPSIPAGRTELREGIWIDRSRPSRLPEVETASPAKAKAIAVGLAAIQASPDLLPRLEALERRVRELEADREVP